MKMETKKGDVRISYVIGGVIALFILVLIIFFLASNGGNLTKYIGWLIPGYKNQTIPAVEGIEIFRYNIADKNAEYYDGVKWMKFDEVTAGRKRVNAKNLENNFHDYYFMERGEKNISIGYLLVNFYQILKGKNGEELSEQNTNFLTEESAKEIGVSDGGKLRINATIRNEDISGSGNVIINLIEGEKGKIITSAGYFVLKLDDSLIFYYNSKIILSGGTTSSVKKESLELLYSEGSKIGEIAKIAGEWRDDIFKKPIRIDYVDTGKGSANSGNYCAEFKDGKYIVVDLGKSTAEEKC